MSRIFLSHSSSNNAEAIALGNWLVAEGWNDLFLDLDPSRGIAAGERWERALNEAANRCEAVLFLVSREWLNSRWCLREFNLALKLNKKMFGLLIEDIPLGDVPAELTATWQLVNLAAGQDHRIFRALLPDGREAHVTFSTAGLTRLRAGLTKAGLDARFFAWPPENDPERPPYRGLRPLEAEDAGIFFGREAPTIEGLDSLRGLSDAAPPRFLVILGASGAGKSSFLRAGLMPRLQRDDRNFLPLPIVRPDRAALSGGTGLMRSLEGAMRSQGFAVSRSRIKAAVEAGAGAVSTLLTELTDKFRARTPDDEGAPSSPRLVLAIDQGEELFLAEGADEAKAFLTLIRELASVDTSNLIVLTTIRSDAYERLQSAPELEGIHQHIFSLPPLPRGAYQKVIEGPAERLTEGERKLKIEPSLTGVLLADIEAGGAKDALPLLAFTLERLYLEHGGDGDLTLAEYRDLGGIKGSIEAAVERALKAADNDPAVPRDRAARLALLRRALIPWLAGIDPDTGSPRRRIARMSEIPEEARPLVNHLIAVGLLATDVSADTGERTIEPAHEALLRQWGLLQGWLEEDFAALSTVEGVRRAAREWSANAREDAWLAHNSGRLDDAEAVSRREDLAPFIDATDRAYLDACRAVDIKRRNRELDEAKKLSEARRKTAQRTLWGAVAAGVLALVAVGAAIYGFDKAREATDQAEVAQRQTDIAREQQRQAEQERNRALIAQSRLLTANAIQVKNSGDAGSAVLLALEALPDRNASFARPYLIDAEAALYEGLASLRESAVLTTDNFQAKSAAFSPDGNRVAIVCANTRVEVRDAATGKLIVALEGAVSNVAFSPDGKQIATSALDNAARIWDATTGRVIFTLTGHTDEVTGVAFSPDGRRVVTTSYDHTARIWDTGTGKAIDVLRAHTDSEVESAAFSPDGKQIVTASNDMTATIWDVETGQAIATLAGHTGPLLDARFSHDGKRIVTASYDETAGVWDAVTGKSLGVLYDLTGQVASALFSPDDSRILTVAADQTARLWDATTYKSIAVLRGHTGDVRTAIFSPDGTQILTSSADATARLWDSQTGEPIAILRGHVGPLWNALFSPDGSRIVTVSADQTARLWNVDAGKPLAVLKGHTDALESAAFSPDGARIVTASDDGTARLWDGESGKALGTLTGHTDKVLAGVFSPDGTHVVTASIDHTGRLWDLATGRSVAVLDQIDGPVGGGTYRPDGKQIVIAAADATARFWDALSGEPVAAIAGAAGETWSTVFSPDGKSIVTTSIDQTAQLWNAGTLQSIAILKGHTGRLCTAIFSPDGKRVATASLGMLTRDLTARIWDAGSGKELAVLNGHRDGINAIAFSPDSTRLATFSQDDTARIWNADTGESVAVLTGHSDVVQGGMFSPDGKRLVTASADQTARIWDAGTGKVLAILAGHTGPVMSAAFSPDGRRIVTASGDHTARLWPVFPTTEDVIDHARAVVPRCLTQTQRQAFLLDPEPPAWCIAMEKWPYQSPDWKAWLKAKNAGANPPLPES